MAKKNDGAVALAAALGFFIVTVVLSPEKLATLLQIKESKIDLAFSQMNNGNVFVGIIIGLIAAYSYNKFSETNLPMALSFFSGKRLVPIMTAFFCTILAIILLLIWPPVYNGIVTFGKWIVGMGPFGALLYGFFNRLLIPTGLHHALNNVFWFDTAGINDIGKFQSGKNAIKGITGRIFPCYDVWCTGSSFGDVSYCKDESKKTSLCLVFSKFSFGILCGCN